MDSIKSPMNEKKLVQLQSMLAEILSEAFKRGFYGTVSLELTVQDGIIQRIRQRVERIR